MASRGVPDRDILPVGIFSGRSTSISIEGTVSTSHQSLGESPLTWSPIFDSRVERGHVSPLLVEEELSLRGSISTFTSSQEHELIIQETRLEPSSYEYPKLTGREIKLGKFLGRGCFSVVEEIRKISVSSSFSSLDPHPRNPSNAVTVHDDDKGNDDNDDDNKGNDDNDNASLEFIAKYCIRPSGDARYALKRLRSDLRQKDEKKLTMAVADLENEAFFLQRLQHTYIVKLLATVHSRNGLRGLVLDRLYDTLVARIRKWKMRSKDLAGLGRYLPWKRERDLEERFEAAFQLSSALRFVHDNKVIHRDIRPENIGFDMRSDIRLFDFGLAKELLEKDSCGNGVYKMSHMTGTLRYMAPEVYFGEAYNEKCDVYSFAVVLWEMLALEQAYNNYEDERSFVASILKGSCRPPLKRKWSKNCRRLLTKAWAPSLIKRLSTKEVNEALRKELILLGWEDGSDLVHKTGRRRQVQSAGHCQSSEKVVQGPEQCERGSAQGDAAGDEVCVGFEEIRLEI